MMHPLKVFIFSLLSVSAWATDPAENLYVTTEHGAIQGTYLNASDDRILAAFLGVPYARPPIGSLRFRKPQDSLPWKSVRITTKPPPSCFQRPDNFFGDFSGAKSQEPRTKPSEDCLYLNVFVPDVVEDEENETSFDESSRNGLPVMVWFHGGGFSKGSAFARGDDGSSGDDSETTWRPDPREVAVEGGVIVVTVQYRLGSFGFLFLDDDGAPGNVGLLDQRKALEWVRKNIFVFGGDPTKITLAGQDAGGISAALHLVMEQEQQPLFNQLILHSSGIQHPWSYVEPKEAFRRTLKLASLLGCPTKGSKQNVILCLTRKSAEDILNKEMGVAVTPGLNYNPFVLTTDSRVVKDEPRNLLKNLKRSDVKVLIGGNRDEGTKALMYFLPGHFPNREIRDLGMSERDFDKAVDKMLHGPMNQQVRDTARFQYTNWSDPESDRGRFEMIVKLAADYQTDCPMEELVDDMADQMQVFRYKFSVRDPQDQWPSWAGVKNGDELSYLFGRPLVQSDEYEDRDKMISKFMIHSWAKFVKSGHPAGRGRGRTVGWPRYTKASRHILHFTESRDILVDTLDQRQSCSFWNKLVPSLQEDQAKQCMKKQSIRKLEERKFLPIKIRRNPFQRQTPTTPPPTTTTTPSPTPPLTTAPPPKAIPYYREPAPINVLSRQSFLNVDTSDFKLVDSGYLVKEEEDEIKAKRDDAAQNPDPEELSFQFSVMGHQQPQQSLDPSWSLYRPESPGNSPIYIAESVIPEEESPPVVVPALPRNRPGGPNRRKDPSVPRPVQVATRTSVRQRPASSSSTSSSVYDPFNPSTYTKSYFRRRKQEARPINKQDQQEVFVAQETRRAPYYYPVRTA